MTTLSRPNSGFTGFQSRCLAGSSSMSSGPAPAIQPSFSARCKAASLTMGPRAVLTRMSVGCGRAVVEHDDRDDAHGRKLAEYVLGGGRSWCHGGDPAAASGPSEPAG